MKITLRPAAADDARMLFDWANEAEIRRMSLSPDPLEWTSHQSWFAGKLKSDTCWIYIAVDPTNEPVGQIRFDLHGEDEAEIDVHTRPDRRGQGIGTDLIAIAATRFFKTNAIRTLTALIRTDNVGSQKAFEKAGFLRVGTDSIGQVECVRMQKHATVTQA